MKPQLVRSLSRSANIPPVALSSDDLRRLHELLDKKVKEACDIQLNGLQRVENSTDEQFEAFKQSIRDQFLLTVMVQGKHGEQLLDTTLAPLSSQNLPDEITAISFECSYMFRTFFNYDPRNRIELTLNFHRQDILDVSNPSGRPTTPISFFNITGDNETWVNGVFQSLHTFFQTKKLKRNYIHGNYFYDLLLWLVVLPMVFWVLHRIDSISSFVPTGALGIGLYIYLAIIMMLGFRFLFNYLRWLYPRTEHVDSRVKPTLIHRLILFAVVTGVISTIITDFLKEIL